jgi:hypothetical protein
MTATFINHVSVHANDLGRRPHPLERHRLAARNDVFDGATIVQSVNGAALQLGHRLPLITAARLPGRDDESVRKRGSTQ